MFSTHVLNVWFQRRINSQSYIRHTLYVCEIPIFSLYVDGERGVNKKG